tara:strand:- start:5130 stop:5903 length:774 start_codon:yes stop_codon:yes gene_type:complete
MNKGKLRRQRKNDLNILVKGINLQRNNPEAITATARRLFSLLEIAKKEGNIDSPIKFLQSQINLSLDSSGTTQLACKKGCSHCCYIWVSATAPEVLYVSKLVKKMGEKVIKKIRQANDFTKDFDFETRHEHPNPCPLLNDNVCSIYNSRPSACRYAASGNADICSRAYHGLSNESIPIPTTHIRGSQAYSLAFAIALKKSGFSYHAYEFNSALIRALDTKNAQKAWLSGDDIFSNVQKETVDIFSDSTAQQFYQSTF